MGKESTVKLKADLSQLKKEFQDAQRHIRTVTSEFNAATAGMSRWSDNADGLTAKLTELNGCLEGERAKLISLEKQYELVVKEQGETSKAAQNLKIQINNQEAAVKSTEQSIQYYSDKLADVEKKSKDASTASGQLKQTISEQEKTLSELKSKYSDLVLEQGKESNEAKQTAEEISKLSAELKENKTKLSDAADAAEELDKSMEEASKSAEESGGGFSVLKGALADLLADGIRATMDALKELAIESEEAYNKFQAQTGESTEEMSRFRKEMEDLYKNNYGESLGDIADKMKDVKDVTREVDSSKIRELTENTIMLEDTFGSDFKESIRGVSNMMTHWGLDSEEAFDLFAKGAQMGLDYTDELGENAAEYAGNFQQAGYSAEEYFQLLANGSQNGAYNLDKVNDSINEVKTRIVDETIKESLDMFSEGTRQAFAEWEKGEGSMKDIIESIVKDINNCENEQEALTMAATAFGSMGEDANLKVIRSLTSTGDAFKNVKGTMEEIKKVRYDDVGNKFKQIGRTLQTDLIMPLAEKALPAAKEFTDFLIKNLDVVVPVAAAAGTAIGTIFVINKVAAFTQSMITMATTFKTLATTIKGAESATKLLAIAQNALPVVAVAAGVAALAGGVIYLTEQNEKAIKQQYGLNEAQKESVENSKSLKEEYTQMNEARMASTEAISNEYSYLSELKEELNGLIDSNGQVKQGYEDRANFIVTELASALGIEAEQIREQIAANGELGTSIDEIIQKKQAEATLSANEAAYTEAIQNRTEALNVYMQSLQTLESAEKTYTETKEAANNVMEQYDMLLRTNPEAANSYMMANTNILAANEEAEESYKKAKQGVKDAEDAYVGYNATIQNYEGLSSAIISGDVDKINISLQYMQNGFITAETGTKASLENQVKNMNDTYINLKTAIEAGTPGVTQAQVDAAQQMVTMAEEELAKLVPFAEENGTNTGQTHADAIRSKTQENQNAADEVATTVNDTLGSKDTRGTGGRKTQEYAQGIDSQNGTVQLSADNTANTADVTFGSKNTWLTGQLKTQEYAGGINSQSDSVYSNALSVAETGQDALAEPDFAGTGSQAGQEFASGIGSQSGTAYSEAKGVADSGKSGLEDTDTYSSGSYFGQGFINGIAAWAGNAWSTAWDLAQKAWEGLKAGQQEGSPSKLTYKSGDFFVQGYVNAIADKAKEAVSQAKKLAASTVSALNDEMEKESMNVTIFGEKGRSMNLVKNAVRSDKEHYVGETTVINNYNFQQTNNSPKALSRLEIYRQTRNQLRFAKGV